jgi:hypothetical protein
MGSNPNSNVQAVAIDCHFYSSVFSPVNPYAHATKQATPTFPESRHSGSDHRLGQQCVAELRLGAS